MSVVKIEEVIGDFVNLKRRGVNYLGLCPFHNEKTPSFTVSPAKGIYKCFGCGKAGSSIQFLMDHEHFTYPESLKYLAKKYQVEIEEEEQSPEQVKEENEKESLFLLNEFARQYFSDTLFEKEEGKAVGLSYLKERGFREDTIRKFQLGYSLESWDDFTLHALDQGYKPDYLAKTGLSIKKETRMIDRFHGRVIFPIHSASGRIIGFGGRILTGDKNVAKYLNSPESEIYNKSKSLYGLHFARNAIISKDTCYLTEGYTDVISLHQSGIENVVASSGTSLTQEQIRLIKRYTRNITILYDGDPAGIKASLRGIDMILEEGMNVKIVLFPEGEDPDSYARKHRSTDVEYFVTKKAANFILFKTKLLLEETAGDPIKKAELIKEIVNTIALIPDGISRSVYIKECSATLQVSEQTLVNEINKIFRKKYSKKIQDAQTATTVPDITEFPAEPQIDYDLDSVESQEREVIRLILLYGNETMEFEQKAGDDSIETVNVKITDFIINDLRNDEIMFENTDLQKIFDEFAGNLDKEIYPDKDHFWNHTDPKISVLSIDLCLTPYEISHNWEKNNVFVKQEKEHLKEIVMTAVLGLKARKIEKLIADNQKKLKEASSDDDSTRLLKEQIGLKTISRDIHDQLGRIIIK